MTTRLLPLALVGLLAACGSHSPGGDGTGGGAAANPGGNGNNPGTDNPGAQPPTATQNRFAMANGCHAIRDRNSGQFVVANADGSLVLGTGNEAQATGFFMKPATLGQYLFFDPAERFLAEAAPLAGAGDAAGDAAGEAGDQVSGAGGMLDLVNPLVPVGNDINDAGQDIGDAGDAAGDAIEGPRSLQMAAEPDDGAIWIVDDAPGGNGFTMVNGLTGNALAVDGEQAAVDFVPVAGCTDYPEAQLNASGEPFSGTLADGTVFGYAETHMHLGGSEALGGRLSYGRPFHKFGITHALMDCAEDHGPNGSTGALDIAVDSNTTVPNHDTIGWPTFNDWPTHSSQTHHQTYYIWLKRAWMGGLRFMVNHLVANEMLCLVWPQKGNDCNEMENARLQLELVEGLQDYIDAQEGGPGEGFFRLVYTPEEARAVIEAGKMAVINGIEMEKIFDCGEFLDAPECTREELDQRIAEWYDMGLRAAFPIHIFDNAFGGAEISRFTSDPALISLYNAGNVAETGHPYGTIPCSQAEAQEVENAETEDRDLFGLILLQATNPPPFPTGGCVNNARPLTELGEYFVNRLIDYGIIIETDHSGPLARKRMLAIAQERGVAVVSGHTGSITPSRDSVGILRTGGILSNLTDDPAEVTIEFIQDLEAAYLQEFGSTTGLSTGFGADINGVHRQPGPREDAAANPLEYPFTSYGGGVVFERQITGERTFDLNTDGVAHYGLYPDYIADIRMTAGGPEALEYLFRSAEGYLRVWEMSQAARTEP